ncbi:MAG: RluA family pseudouridine synthase [Verrucomicrobiae bacterium]|nr:RluA family pseudouridine synthase [Verrucomicrobiae bacterium]
MDSPSSYTFTVESEDHGRRVDIFLPGKLTDVSRSFCQKLIRESHVTVNGVATKPSHSLRMNDVVAVTIPPPHALDLQPEDIPLDVLFEDDDLLVLNKPPGLVVHPAAGNMEHTLVHALLHHCRGKLSGIGGVTRPGIVHRLDKDTSGCLVVAKNDVTHRSLVEQFKERDVWKEYLALVWGNIAKTHGQIDSPIGRNPRNRQKMAVNVGNARPSLTEYEVVERFKECCVIRVILHTGRTHQIRVHFASIGHPVLGDEIYGRKRQSELVARMTRQMLHAHRLGFEHPRTRKLVESTAPLPADMRGLLAHLRKENQSGKRSSISRSTSRTSTSEKPLR